MIITRHKIIGDLNAMALRLDALLERSEASPAAREKIIEARQSIVEALATTATDIAEGRP